MTEVYLNGMSHVAAVAAILLLLFGCGSGPAADPELIEIASSEMRWTGVAVSEDGRIFTNYPRWSNDVTTSVVEIMPDGTLKPYPSQTMNTWEDTIDPLRQFVCVQSVVCDGEGSLWVLDPANPYFSGVFQNGAKLIKIDLATDEVVKIYNFDSTVTPKYAYLNDVRIDNKGGFAYMTESGSGAIVVLDLNTGEARRLLDRDPSTSAENVTLTIGGTPWVGPDGASPKVHSDGIALSLDRKYLYYQALTGRTLYRIAIEHLHDSELDEEALGEKVEVVAKSGAADGIAFDQDGRLYISALEDDAVKRLLKDNTVETLKTDTLISWPDSFAFGPDGSLYFTTSRIHEAGAPTGEFKIYKINQSDL